MGVHEEKLETVSEESKHQLRAGAQFVEDGCIVTMDYVVSLVTGKVIDSSEKSGRPASFICGKGNFPKPVEEGILGLAPGESKIIKVHPFYAYGLYDPKKQLLIASERISVPVDEGKVIKVPDELGITRPAVIRDIWKGAIMVDFNHPLAGQILTFEVSIRRIQAAPSEEKDLKV